MKVECLFDLNELDDIELDLNDELDIDSNSDLNQAFNNISNPYLEWAEENKHYLFKSSQRQLIFKFYLEFKDKNVWFDYPECESLCIFYLNKVLNADLKQVLNKELIQKELDSFLKVQLVIGKIKSIEEYQLELKRKSDLIKSDLKVLNLRFNAYNWIYLKHNEIFIQLDNPKVSNHNFNKLVKSAIKWDLKQNKQGILKDSLIPDLELIYLKVFKTFREYSIQTNRLTLLDNKSNKQSPLKSTHISAVGASKSDYKRVATNATGSTATSKQVKLTLPACSKPNLYPLEHSLSDLPYDSPLRTTPLIKVLRKRKITG